MNKSYDILRQEGLVRINRSGAPTAGQARSRLPGAAGRPNACVLYGGILAAIVALAVVRAVAGA